MAKMSTTSRQTTAAVALTITLRLHPGPDGSGGAWSCPAPAMVKPVNTPMAYIGMSAATLARVATSSAIEATARTMMPFENTSRWPRTVRGRGRNESSATKLTRNGKPVKLVLAARIKISAVAACRQPVEDRSADAWP